MSRHAHTGIRRLGVLAAAIAALAVAGCQSAPAPTSEPAAPSVTPSAAPVVTDAPAPASVAPASVAPAASDSAAVPPPVREAMNLASVGASPAASAAVAREAGAFSKGTATCIWNQSSDDLRIAIVNADDNQAEYANTNGTEALRRGTFRCMKGDSATASGAPLATITIASGESFRLVSYNPPFGGCSPWIAVNGDSLCPAEVGGTKTWKIGKHPITGKRVADTEDFKIFEVRIGG